LPKLYQRVVIPHKVWEEITIHGAGLPGALAISQLDWLIMLATNRNVRFCSK
jgi:predicted nucleic acid-binding protein